MMIKIHQNTSVVLAVLVLLILAFVALMVFEWGADYSASAYRSDNIIGIIDGKEVTYQEFAQEVQYAYQNEQQQSGSSLDEEQVQQLRGRVWEQMVQREILGKQIARMNIQVTEEDVYQYIINNPDPAIRQAPQFQTNGQFDINKYKEILSDPQNEPILVSMERQTREQLPYIKLVDKLSSSVIVTEPEVRDEYMRLNVKAKIEYLAVPLRNFRNQAVEVAEAEIMDFYKANKDDFKIEERRSISYALFSTEPSAQDTADVITEMERIKQKALDGADFGVLATEESEEPAALESKGDLGYFDRKTMVKEFTDAAFSAKPGDLVGPVKTRFGVHIIKVHDKKMEDGEEKVHASHILKKFVASTYTTDNAFDGAQNFSEKAQDGDFAALAEAAEVSVQTVEPFVSNNFGNIPGLGRSENALSWIFKEAKGKVSDVFRLSQGYVVMKIATVEPAGFKPFEEVEAICKSRAENEKLMALARAHAESLQSAVEAANGDFASVAANDASKLSVADTTDYFGKTAIIPKVGKSAEVAAMAFTLPVSTVSGLLESNQGYFYIKVKDRQALNEEEYKAQRKSIRDRIARQKSQSIFRQWYEGLKKDTEIVDNRYRFYRS